MGTGSRGHVLVGYDGSPSSERALRWAVREASMRYLPLVVCNAFEWPLVGLPPSGEAIDRMMHAAEAVANEGVLIAKGLDPRLEVHARPSRGAPAKVLISQSAAEVVVVGGRDGNGAEREPPRGATGAGRDAAEAGRGEAMAERGGAGVERGAVDSRVGSVPAEVCAYGNSPTVVVRGAVGDAAVPGGSVVEVDVEADIGIKVGIDVGGTVSTGAVGRGAPPVVVGVDGSDAAAAAALGFAFEEAALRRVPLRAVYGWPPPPEGADADTGESRRTAAARFQRMVTVWMAKYPWVGTETRFVTGSAREALLMAAADAMLLVVGGRGRDAPSEPPLDPVAEAALLEARCPVAVTHAR
jgi:nucleotide-binding universal stress UspA family protein